MPHNNMSYAEFFRGKAAIQVFDKFKHLNGSFSFCQHACSIAVYVFCP